MLNLVRYDFKYEPVLAIKDFYDCKNVYLNFKYYDEPHNIKIKSCRPSCSLFIFILFTYIFYIVLCCILLLL